MSNQAVLLPLLVQVALTFAIGFWMASKRVIAIRSRAVRARDVALREPNWPTHLMQLQNAFLNQLELPVLFYLLTILVLITRTADLWFVVPAWIFIALRLAHAYVHVTRNIVRLRGLIFIAGAVVLCAMWIIFAVRIISAA